MWESTCGVLCMWKNWNHLAHDQLKAHAVTPSGDVGLLNALRDPIGMNNELDVIRIGLKEIKKVQATQHL